MQDFGFRRGGLLALSVLLVAPFVIATTQPILAHRGDPAWEIVTLEVVLVSAATLALNLAVRMLSVRVTTDDVSCRGLFNRTQIEWKQVRWLTIARGRFILESDRDEITLVMLHYARCGDLLAFFKSVVPPDRIRFAGDGGERRG